MDAGLADKPKIGRSVQAITEGEDHGAA